MFWEHPDVTERCSLWHLLCDQRDSFKQNVYQSLPQSLCSSLTRHSSALCQHLPNRFWNVLFIFRNHIILFRKNCLPFGFALQLGTKPDSEASRGSPQTAPEMPKDEHIWLAQLCWSSWPKWSICYRVWLSSYLFQWLHCCSAEILGGPWGHHECSAPGTAESIKKQSLHMASLVDWDQLVQSCGNHRASCNSSGARVHSHVLRERPIIISAETRSGTRAGQGTKH